MARALVPHMITDHGYQRNVVLDMSVLDMLEEHKHDHELAELQGVKPHPVQPGVQFMELPHK